jgi:nitrogen fixation protein
MIKHMVGICALAVMVVPAARTSAAVVVNDTQVWGTGGDIENMFADGPGWRLVVNALPSQTLEIGPSGNLTVNGRTDMGTSAPPSPDNPWVGDITILVSGTLTTNGSFKLPGVPPAAGSTDLARVILNGLWNALEIEGAYDPWRRGQLVIGENGELLLQRQGPGGVNANYEVRNMLTRGSIVAADGYTLVFEDLAGNPVDPSTYSGVNDSMRIYAVPEPSTLALLGLGGVGVWLFTRRRA